MSQETEKIKAKDTPEPGRNLGVVVDGPMEGHRVRFADVPSVGDFVYVESLRSPLEKLIRTDIPENKVAGITVWEAPVTMFAYHVTQVRSDSMGHVADLEYFGHQVGP